MANTITRVQKNDVVWEVTVGWGDDDHGTPVRVQPLRIMSWGKKQGTAVGLDTMQYVRHSFSVERAVLDGRAYEARMGNSYFFATKAEALAWVEANADALRAAHARAVAGTIRCEEAALDMVLPKYRPAVDARLAQLRQLHQQPQYTVEVREMAAAQ